MSKAPSDRTRVKRLPKRGAYDKGTIHAILDEGLVCHIGFIAHGHPFVIPMTYARDGERLLVHGSRASRVMKAIAAGVDLCVTVTHNDGLVLARSAFHHSMNYRSVVILGKGRSIDDPEAKLEAFRRYFAGLIPGRWDDVRPPNQVEMDQTLMVEIPIDEASAKARTGMPMEEETDYALDAWAGLIPMETTVSAAVPDDRLRDGVDIPDYAANYKR